MVDIEYSIQNIDYQSLKPNSVITGWFGEGKDGNIALLDRGGSDHSATAIARILDAEGNPVERYRRCTCSQS